MNRKITYHYRSLEMGNATSINQAYPAVVTNDFNYDAWGLSIETLFNPTYSSTFGPFNSPNSQRHRYNGKEQITSSRFYDYGARQYDPVIGRWLSVDPLAEKYLGLSVYNYVANNPVNAIDPNGLEIILVISRNNQNKIEKTVTYNKGKFYNSDGSLYQSEIGFSKRVGKAIDKIRNSDKYLEKIISKLEDSEFKHYIDFDNGYNASVSSLYSEGGFSISGSYMKLNFRDVSKKLGSGEKSNLESTMAHEFSHVYDLDTGNKDNVDKENKGTERDTNEIRAVNVENRYRAKNKMELRTNYGNSIDPKNLENPYKPKQE